MGVMTDHKFPPLGPSLGFLLNDAARLMRRRFEQRSRDIPMTSAQMRIIARLARNEGISQAALAAMVDLEPMTLCRHIDRMASGGLVVREPDPNDRRARKLYTTDKARALIQPMFVKAEAIFEEAQAGLDPEARARFFEALTLIVKNLSDPDAGPDASLDAAPEKAADLASRAAVEADGRMAQPRRDAATTEEETA
ncbi:MarR family winged helix-turn-helix transcriptional regulator [Aurantimonas sp. 22II-16-19i]|uniref:MarR family winged helix-turn-helix transcriptional regulator n=1 Tax=Aurantimonas sp. 22II-16-19i TaxID=1317114 RepID=UPI0009F7BC33|nr:MarR family winged helix-turn-helix transcriptional regulator [Aurantimonas sp. 22II-16-19i]ORE98068.1 transcriptional regulator [Aurantimonas sp. 22II-16-19i]